MLRKKQIRLFLLVLFTAETQQTNTLCDVCLCDGPQDVPTKINCDNKEIGASIYNKLNSSEPISSLTLQFNNITELKVKFPRCHLKLLNLGHNLIRIIGKGIFSNLQIMNELNLGYNNIENIEPEAFRGEYSENEYFPLKSLKSLNLEYNKLHTLDADLFEHIDELETLNLRGNPFKVIDVPTVTAIANLINLRSLDLSSAQLKDLPLNFMHVAKLLTRLNLSSNGLELIPSTFGEAQALETLYFDNNPIQKLSAENAFTNIPTLKVLHLSNMPKLEELGAHSLGGLQNLKEIYIANNRRLSVIHPDFLLNLEDNKHWPPLVKVFLSGNNITQLNNNTLPSWPILEVLDISENPWLCSCENTWLIKELLPIRQKIGKEDVGNLRCMHPAKLRNKTFSEIRDDFQIRCNEQMPSKQILLLIGTISGILVAVACILFIIYSMRYRRHGGTLFEMTTGLPIYRKV